jgi:uncharacterized protein (DUF433 family)
VEEKYNYQDRIVIDNNIHFGKPCVGNTRITVENVLELVQENISFKDIKEKFYPDLTIDDIKACIGFAIVIV